MRAIHILPLVAFLAVVAPGEFSVAQTAPGYPAGVAYGGGVRMASYQQTTGQNNPAIGFFGRPKAMAYAPQSRFAAPAPVAVQTAAPGKPFAAVQQGSNVTPYLALDYAETPTGIPNYYMFVRPRLDAQQHADSERVQFRRFQQKLRKVEAGGAVSNPSGGIPTTGHSSQFMNIGGYYPSGK